MMGYISVYYSGDCSRRPRPRSLCARCGGIAQDESLLSTRAKSSDRGPCNLSIEVDGREGRQGRRRHSSTGRDSSMKRNPLCFIAATGSGKKAGSVTTYRESFRSPPPEELKARIIRSLPSSPITASASPPRSQREALAREREKASQSVDDSGESPPLIKQTERSPSLVSLLNNETGPDVPRPTKGKGNPTAAAKGKAHQVLWSDKGDLPAPPASSRRSGKGLVHQPLWTDNGETLTPAPTSRRSAKGLAHQPLWSEGGSAPVPAPAPTPRRSAKGLSHQPLWTETAPDPAPVRMSRRPAARSVSESEVVRAAGIKTQPPSSLGSSLALSWAS